MTQTGLLDVDKILGDTTMDVEPMLIDKVQFDNVILPLILGEVEIGRDDAFTHLRNMWINYYKEQKHVGVLVQDGGGNIVNSPLTGNAVFTSMRIVDIDGSVIATTPPLIEPAIIDGCNQVFISYIEEMRHNPNEAKVKLINSVSRYKIADSGKWSEFISSYTGVSVADDSDELFIME